ncbi:MAG: protein kinase [Gammaproteobacteria bacterium]|jgi:serine/threonine protein phosphatase PrpC/predicted Ser/Thr protein kinase
MSSQLQISVGQHSDKGRKDINQDFHGVYIPDEPQLTSKGIAITLADGISSSKVSQIASETAVAGFLQDYYCTSEAWSVKSSAQRVLYATNSWLYSQTRQSQFRYEKDKGYVCTFSAMVIKSATAYIFHVGDSRVYRLRNGTLEQLTDDHRLWVSQEQSYLSRALGINPQLDLDYKVELVELGDVFLFTTDGVYEYVSTTSIVDIVAENKDNLEKAAKEIVKEAYDNGSDDNLTIQIVRVEALPQLNANEVYRQLTDLPFPPALQSRMIFDGYRIVRELHASHRSHVFLAVDGETGTHVAIKTPSFDLRADSDYMERFLMEEWIARRINNAHVLKSFLPTRKHNYLYTVSEFIDGQTLAQWMIDNPKPDVETVRGIVEQIAKGLRAFHRMEMLHQDLRPNNIMIDTTGTVKLIDFGSARVAGLMENALTATEHQILGTEQYSAPEYFLGEGGTTQSDLFSLGVITYQMLSGKLPYGTHVPRARTRAAQRKLRYLSVMDDDREIPLWVDEAIKKSVHPNPYQRYQELSEFIFDLRHPNKAFLNRSRPPLLERNPVLFWKGISLILAMIIIVMVVNQQAG